MNFQTPTLDADELEDMNELAWEVLDSPLRIPLQYYAWPQVWASTAGPRKGVIAGQAMTTFTVRALIDEASKSSVVFCNGWYAVVDTESIFKDSRPYASPSAEWKPIDVFKK